MQCKRGDARAETEEVEGSHHTRPLHNPHGVYSIYDHPCRAPLRGGARSRQTHGPAHDPITVHAHPAPIQHGSGVWGRPSRRAAARSPHPTLSSYLSGTRGGLDAPRRGARVRGPTLLFPPQKSRQRAGGDHRASGPCVRITPPPRFLSLGCAQLDSADADGGSGRGCLHPCHSALKEAVGPGGAGRVGGLPSTPALPT